MSTSLRFEEEIDLVFSGSGTLLPCHIGAWKQLEESGAFIQRVAGTSGGGIVAAAVATGMTPTEALELSKKFLGGGLLDSSWWFFDRWGIHKWERIHKLLAKHIPGKMSDVVIDLRLMVVDLETQRPVEITSASHPDLLIADVLAATSAIPAFVKVRSIPGLKGCYVDGGVSTNFAMGSFDDVPTRRTVGVRLAGTPSRKKISSTSDWAKAVVGSMHDAANHSYVSKKKWADVIAVKSSGDGMDFTLSADQIDKLYSEGVEATKAWLSVRDA